MKRSSAQLSLASALSMCVSGAALAQTQILETYDACLTKYQYTSDTSIQKIRPLDNGLQYGVQFDGTARAPSPLGWALNGNPFESPAGTTRIGDIRLDTGTYAPTVIDMALPATGFRLTFGRTYNGRQESSTPGHRDSDGIQGKNWQQTGLPEIVRFAGATADLDVVYLVYGADRYIALQRTGVSASTFKSKNGAAGTMLYAANGSGEPETYTYYDLQGMEVTFLGFDGDAGVATGQFWKMKDPAGNVAYVGSSTLSSSTATTGYSSGRATTLYDSAELHRYTLTYTTIDSVSRLTQIKAETKTGGTWASPTGVATTEQVDYDYYKSADASGVRAYGDDGNLKLVTVTTPLTDSGVDLVKKTYYRYWKGEYNSETNPGYPNTLQYVVEAEGYRQADWAGDTSFDDDPLTMTESSLKPYSSVYLEYDSSYRIKKFWFNGQCGCGGGALNGVTTLTYDTNGSYTNGTGYDTAWARRTVVHGPTNWRTVYTDEVGQVLTDVVTSADPTTNPSRWLVQIVRDSVGQVSDFRSPAANDAYTHDSGGSPSGAVTAFSGAGLVTSYTRVSSSHAKGYIKDIGHRTGSGGTLYYDRSNAYADDNAANNTPETTVKVSIGGSLDMYRPVKWWSHDYATETSTATTPTAGTDNTDNVVAHSSSLALKTTTHIDEVVSTATNGSGSANSASASLRTDRTLAFSKSRNSRIDYSALTNGQLATSITDADTTKTASGEDFNGVTIPAGFSSSGAPQHLKTTYTYDGQGRVSTTKSPFWNSAFWLGNPRALMYYSKLADGRAVTIAIPQTTTVIVEELGTVTSFYGPCRYTVTNLAGRMELSGTIGFSSAGITTALTSWINEGSSDAIATLGVGSLSLMTTNLYDATGTQLQKSRTYFVVPGSGVGTAGTNYDERAYTYDDAGRLVKVLEPTTTINSTVYDVLGRVTERWIGTDDSGGGGQNMVKTSSIVYDDGYSNRNSYVTKRTAFIQDSTTGQRETVYINDVRGRPIVIDNPSGPDTLMKYNNRGQPVTVGTYSTASGQTVSSDPTSLATARVGRVDTDYDALFRPYKTTVHKITQSDGSDASDDLVSSQTWYDEEGRSIKTRGEQMTKTFFDRLGRTTNRFVLAYIDEADTAYSDAKTVTSDKVLEETQSYIEATTGNVLMTVLIQRHPNDTSATTTALDTDSDLSLVDYSGSKIKGRPQITATFYDWLNRVTDVVTIGTNGGTNYDRDSDASAPSRSATRLVTTYSYNDNGTLLDVRDPNDIVTRTLYDAAGRRLATIGHFLDGSPSGDNNDDDVYTRYVYANGLITKMWVDLDGDDAVDTNDQVTTYIYGSAKGSPTPMKIATGHLLRAVKYPDSTNSGTTFGYIDGTSSADVVSYAYNAQGQQTYVKDQAGNVIEMQFDTAGRQTERLVTTVVSGYDDYVKRIATTYVDRGMVDKVTQYSTADLVTPGTIRDQVQYTYDDRGSVTKFNQDIDSAIGVSGRAAFATDFTYSKTTHSNGRKTIRRDTIAYAGTTITNGYGSSGSFADTAVRVAKLTQSSVDIATYDYLGAGQVVTTVLSAFGSAPTTSVFNSGATTYPYLDSFNRITSSRWSQPNDIYRVDLTYDPNGNIVLAEDYVLKAAGTSHLYDVVYSYDALNRLTDAQEGHWDGSTISTVSREQDWILSQSGNMVTDKIDADGTGGFETDWTGVFNKANEYASRDNGGTYDILAYNDVGGMSFGGPTYVYDVFGRLKRTEYTIIGGTSVVVEYKYNGLGYRIGWHYDVSRSGGGAPDGTLDSNDPWYYFCYDDRWRVVATFLGSDSSAKERFVFHNAGANGVGGSSYIDLVVLRDKDANTAWPTSTDGTLEERNYYCQNWRADVSVLLDSDSFPVEWIKYSSYGVASSFALADYDLDGDIDTADNTAYNAAKKDLNGDGTIDGKDDAAFAASYDGAKGTTGGIGNLSRSGTANRVGYAGYQWDPVIGGYHVRHRVYNPALGRWMSRDPLDRESDISLRESELSPYEYVNSRPVSGVDSHGLTAEQPGGDAFKPRWRWLEPFLNPNDPNTYPINPNNGMPLPNPTGISPPTVPPGYLTCWGATCTQYESTCTAGATMITWTGSCGYLATTLLNAQLVAAMTLCDVFYPAPAVPAPGAPAGCLSPCRCNNPAPTGVVIRGRNWTVLWSKSAFGCTLTARLSITFDYKEYKGVCTN